ncbi:Coenzyme F420 hydrogenase/dehydrogenase, beta subunit C-terminal domain [Glaciecola sp. SC05]|uniref:Coenzyme F420 hydrogenase/dehydrogenase, beta subunit C-terminal domain n=1 Tax=Glaciecola sp. SC05 TaxID=1987355 RepID=UPI003528A9DA
MSKPQVISKVVENDMCIGCGVCTYACPSDALSMGWSKDGFLIPELTGDCDADSSCIKVCPFNPTPFEEVKDETALAEIFLAKNTQTQDKLGKVIGIYTGYSREFRDKSSSGGMATYIFDELLDRGVVEHIFSVRSSDASPNHYEYQVSSNKTELRNSSKTRYYPVTLATVLPELKKLDGRVAIVGIACFVKAIRLAQYNEPELKQKIPFIAGIICGGVKSKFFTEYLASKVGADHKNIKSPSYRIKDATSTANDYSFGCIDVVSKDYKQIKMRAVGDMWGTGLFKANACDYCDDVVTELADISLGDAWHEPYRNDGRGTSVIITRSPLAETIMQEGIKNLSLSVEPITPDVMRASQEGSFNHRHEGLYVRVKEAKNNGIPIPEKRYGKKLVTPDIFFLQKLRRRSRKESLEVWKNSKTANEFNSKMEKTLSSLKLATNVTRYKRGAIRLLKKILMRKR